MTPLKYQIFNEIIESDILLPELTAVEGRPASIFYSSGRAPSIPDQTIDWFHHWRLPNDQIGLSIGRSSQQYWLKFPGVADFCIDPTTQKIIGYGRSQISDSVIRHLLLDQIVPRLLTHEGQQVIHASCIQLRGFTVAFCGQTGWGKSTIAAWFHNQGYKLLTDDCLLLQLEPNGEVLGFPNYHGIRLYSDSFSVLSPKKRDLPVVHFGDKKRLIMESGPNDQGEPLRALFILSDPCETRADTSVTISGIGGSEAAVELVKNSFPLDITNGQKMGRQLQLLADIGGAESLSLYRLIYPRRYDVLPQIRESILNLFAGTESGFDS